MFLDNLIDSPVVLVLYTDKYAFFYMTYSCSYIFVHDLALTNKQIKHLCSTESCICVSDMTALLINCVPVSFDKPPHSFSHNGHCGSNRKCVMKLGTWLLANTAVLRQSQPLRSQHKGFWVDTIHKIQSRVYDCVALHYKWVQSCQSHQYISKKNDHTGVFAHISPLIRITHICCCVFKFLHYIHIALRLEINNLSQSAQHTYCDGLYISVIL